ncbi:RING/U-box protein with C6HC-type zinc finger [Raphanus sativus]|nr:RING/U-box protein with C6HC-type zinc finger [Raphanus sativus]
MEGSVLGCPRFECKSKLTLTSCSNLLTPKLREMWQERINEEAVPVVDRVYCPNPRCSALMSGTELSKSSESMRSCIKCDKPFCINCKVAWHSNLSCEDYKRLGPNPTENDIKLKALANQKMWRQCGRCQYMIELSYGCSKIVCRCGYSFCYKCGAQWTEGGCPHRVRAIAAQIFLIVILVLIGLGIFLWENL